MSQVKPNAPIWTGSFGGSYCARVYDWFWKLTQQLARGGGASCTQVALKLHWVFKSRKTLRFSRAANIGNDGDCVRVPTSYVRVIRLENRLRLTPFESSNLTRSATEQPDGLKKIDRQRGLVESAGDRLPPQGQSSEGDSYRADWVAQYRARAGCGPAAGQFNTGREQRGRRTR